MISHVTLGISDFARSRTFYDTVLGLLGMGRFHDDEAEGWLGYGQSATAMPQIWLGRPFDGRPAAPGNGTTVAFDVAERGLVDRFYRAALALGAHDEGAPGLRPHYHANYYGAYVRDPDGHKLACVCHRPVAA